MAAEQVGPLMQVALVFGGAEPAQAPTLVGQVRLIREAAGERHAGPVDAARALSERVHALEPFDAAEPLGWQTHLRGELGEERAMAEMIAPFDGARPHQAPMSIPIAVSARHAHLTQTTI